MRWMPSAAARTMAIRAAAIAVEFGTNRLGGHRPDAAILFGIVDEDAGDQVAADHEEDADAERAGLSQVAHGPLTPCASRTSITDNARTPSSAGM